MLSESGKEQKPAEDSASESSDPPATEPPTTEPPANETPAPETSDSPANTGDQPWKMPWEKEGAQAGPNTEPPAEENPPPAETSALVVEPPTEEAPPEAIADPAPAAPPIAAEPAPSITVDPTNTRHLAWLFGAKFSLSLLANEKNSTTEQQVVWQAETAKLAGALGLASPTATGSGPPAERVPQLLAESQKLGAELAAKHGAEAAALVELAVKSNLLLGLDENRRTFAPVIAKSLRSAAARTTVPADVWESPLNEIAAATDNAAIEQAVYELHKRMEAALRLK